MGLCRHLAVRFLTLTVLCTKTFLRVGPLDPGKVGQKYLQKVYLNLRWENFFFKVQARRFSFPKPAALEAWILNVLIKVTPVFRFVFFSVICFYQTGLESLSGSHKYIAVIVCIIFFFYQTADQQNNFTVSSFFFLLIFFLIALKLKTLGFGLVVYRHAFILIQTKQ